MWGVPFVTSANLGSRIPEQRAPSVATPAARRAVAALAARILGAPVGFVSFGDVVDFRGQLVAGWEPDRPDRVARAISQLLGSTSASVRHDDLSGSEAAQDGVCALVTAPIRSASGALVGHVGALDVELHPWSSADVDSLEDFAAMVGATPDLESAAGSEGLRQHVRSLVQEVRALDGALVPLIQRAEESGDAALAGHASTVRSRLLTMRGHQDGVRARAGIVGPIAGTVDLAALVAGVLDDVARRIAGERVRLTGQDQQLPVITGEVATRDVLSQFLEHVCRQFGVEAVAVELRRLDDAEDERSEAELEIRVAGFVRAGDLARVGAGLGRSQGAPVGGTHIEIRGDRILLRGADHEAESSPDRTIVRARWPLGVD